MTVKELRNKLDSQCISGRGELRVQMILDCEDSFIGEVENVRFDGTALVLICENAELLND